jgi:hypothetical protein
MEGDELPDYCVQGGHIQVSEPFLIPLVSVQESKLKIDDKTHKELANKFITQYQDCKVSLEMKEVKEEEFEDNIRKFVRLYA